MSTTMRPTLQTVPESLPADHVTAPTPAPATTTAAAAPSQPRHPRPMFKLKGLPMSKDEVALLINLIIENKIITSKATNATNNKLKDETWHKITDAFNASITSCPRKVEQLRLKWENLKKAARKRTTKIRMNNIKTGGGKPEYIAPDDALDQVAAILGTTCEGYTVPYGGDAEVQINEGEVIIIEHEHFPGNALGGGVSICEGEGIKGGTQKSEGFLNGIPAESPKQRNNKFFFSTPSGSSNLKQKRKLQDEESKARSARNKAIAEYYELKKRKVQLDIEQKELTNKKLKYETEKLKLELEKLKQ